jgi:hypothetical protein
MTLSALGIFSAAGAGGVVAGTYELIETISVSSSQASITFSNLGTYSSTYKHLQLRAVHKNSRANLWSGTVFRFNADTGNNYSYHGLFGNGTFASGTNEVSISGIIDPFAAGNTATNVFSPTVYDILDPFSTSKNKTVRYLTGRNVGGGEDRLALMSGLWNSTASVTSITMLPTNSLDWVSGCRFSLYGIRG